jgi:nucleoside-diphosphate-sugar epimerase
VRKKVGNKILVTAAGGNQGKILIPKLAKAGFTVRAMRFSKGADELLALGASDVMIGDASNPSDVEKAMEGVSTIYHVGPTVHPHEKAMGLTVIEAARKAGDKHLIYSSTMHAATSEMVPHRVKNEIEEQLIQSGVDFTILKPSGYMVRGFLQSAFATGTLHVFFDPDRGQAKTNLDDFTDVVVKVACERERHFAASYELNSDVCHSIHEIAAMISKVTKKDINVRRIGVEQLLRATYGSSFDPDELRYEIDAFQSMATWCEKHDLVGNTNVMTWLLNRHPMTMAAYIQQQWEAFRPPAVRGAR